VQKYEENNYISPQAGALLTQSIPATTQTLSPSIDIFNTTKEGEKTIENIKKNVSGNSKLR
jgi:hypothetical protein